jgi:hypothetical protein
MFEILPTLGFHLEWCNLDRNISSATWRSDHGTIVLADSWTWIPLPLGVIAGETGMVKYEMPRSSASADEWVRYCTQDTETLYNVVRALMAFVSSERLGNWQPTGAGMAMATWRHRFMEHKVLVHDDGDALAAERSAMHTGRAEAWRHGKIHGEQWTEIDLRNAYVTIAATTELPRKLHMRTGALDHRQYTDLHSRFAVLARCEIHTDVEATPHRADGRHSWPVGKFETWIWDTEIDDAIRSGAEVRILETFVYVRDFILRDWARWTLAILGDASGTVPAVVRTHVKHCARAFIGRLSLRTPTWEYFGCNVDGHVGITHVWLSSERRSTRFLHVGDDTLIETSREEGKDSLPMITGYIMSKCRSMIWEAMNAAGLDNLAHVDTDSVLCNRTGLDRMRVHYGDRFPAMWTVKGTYSALEVLGPRQYWRDKQRVTSGIPLKAAEQANGTYTAERWSSLAADLEHGSPGTVTLSPGTWRLRTNDPRRGDSPGAVGRTVPYVAGTGPGAKGSSEVSASIGS